MRRVKGNVSLELVSAMSVLAEAEYQIGNLEKDMNLEREVLNVRTELLGKNNSATLDAKDNIAVT